MIPYGCQNISQDDINAVIEVLRSDFLTQGPVVPRFELALAEYCGARHGVAVNSATSALHIACLALDVGPGDWVWTSPNTFVASANCVLYCGAKVDFVDIDPRTYNMSAEQLSEKLEIARASNRLPKVVIPVHFAGQSCDMAAIFKLSQEYGFKIIEDASHAVGASYLDTKIGSGVYSDITVFSFHPVKIITTGEGGMAMTNNPSLMERMFRHRSHGITSTRELMKSRPSAEIWNYQQIDIGYNYRMTDLQAALGISQLTRIDEFIDRRREIAHLYDSAFADLPLIKPWQLPDARSSFHLYPLRIRKSLCGTTQKQVYDQLWRSGVGVNLHYIPVYRHPHYEALGFQAGYCPEAEAYHREALTIPIFPTLSSEQQGEVVYQIKKVLLP